MRCLLVCLVLSFALKASAGKSETKRVNVGDEFTVYTTSYYYLQAVTWSWDTGCLELVGSLYETSTSATFRVKKATPMSGVIIQATIYYYRSGTTSSGINKDVDVWRVFAEDKSTVSLNYHNYTMSPGESFSLTATPSNSSYFGEYSWESSYPSVAYISGYDNSVRVYARESGSTTITVRLDNGKYDQCYVTVRNIEPTNVRIDSYLTTYVGEGQTIYPSLTPSDAQTTYTWHVVDKSVASVSSSGYVSGIGEGTTSVYCTTANGLTSNYCMVSVYYRTPSSIEISPSGSISVPIGHTKSLSYKVSPSNARYSVTWKSEDEGIATVSQSGVVTGIKEGTTYIKVSTDNGKTARCKVIVPPNPSALSLPGKISLCYGRSRTLKSLVSPADAFYELTWTSSNDKPAEVKAKGGADGNRAKVVSVSSGGTVTALRPGTAVVTATTQNGKSASCIVEVPEVNYMFYVWTKSGEKIGYSLNEHPKSKYDGDAFLFETDKVRVTYPAADIRKFTMADESIDPIPSGIEMNEELTLRISETARLEYTLLPLDYDIETSLTWKSDNTRCATVSGGVVTARTPGEANITLTAGNGCMAQCHVTVPEPEYNLVVWLCNGETNLFSLAEHPVAEYRDGSFFLRTSQTEVTYDAESVRKFTLQDGDIIDAVPYVAVQEHEMHYGSGTVEISNGKANSSVTVYTSGGITVSRMRLDGNGCLQFSTSDYPSGIYIIRTETTTFKILKK